MPYLDVEGLKTIQKRVNSLYVRKDRIVNNQSTTATGMVLKVSALLVILLKAAKKQVPRISGKIRFQKNSSF